MAAAIAYYTVFSIPPVLIIALAIAGYFYKTGTAQDQLLAQIAGFTGPQIADFIKGLLINSSYASNGPIASIISVVILLVSASGIFYQMQHALNRMWDVPTTHSKGFVNTIKDHFQSFLMVLAISFLDHDADNLVFIAGGIGITPFMSMLRYMVDKKLERNVLLLWGNKTEKDIAFRDGLHQMASALPGLRVIHVLSNQPDWPGEKGYMDAGLLHKYLDGIASPEIFVCGPPLMMVKVIRALRQSGTSKARIHYERFALQRAGL